MHKNIQVAYLIRIHKYMSHIMQSIHYFKVKYNIYKNIQLVSLTKYHHFR